MKIAPFMLVACGFLLAACGESSTPSDDAAQSADSDVACPRPDADGRISIRPGLDARILKKGYGRAARSGDDAGVHAVLWLLDENAPGRKGLEVWSSGGVDPFVFRIGQDGFIAGWNPGIECMLLGEKRELVIAPELAYGERGRPPVPPNATLLYELELASLEMPEAPTR